MLSALHPPQSSSHINSFIAQGTTQLHLDHGATAVPVTSTFKTVLPQLEARFLQHQQAEAVRQQSSFHQAKFAQRMFLPQSHLLLPDGRRVSLAATRYSGAAATTSLQERGVVCGKDHRFGFPWAEARKSATFSISSGPPRPWMVERHLQEKDERKAEQCEAVLST